MKRIVSANAVADRPTEYSADGATMGFFQEPNFGTNPPTPGTVVDAEWANSVQEEIAQTVVVLGGTLTAKDSIDPATAQLPGLLSGVLRGETALPGAAIAFSRFYPPACAIPSDPADWELDVGKGIYSATANGALCIPLSNLPENSSITGFSIDFENFLGSGNADAAIFMIVADSFTAQLDLVAKNLSHHSFSQGVANYSFNVSPSIPVTNPTTGNNRYISIEIVATSPTGEGASFLFRGLTVKLSRTTL